MAESTEQAAAKRPTIVLVDDEENVLRALRRTLRKVDADLLTVNSPTAALELIEKRKPAVIISDMRMPEMTGAELLAKARLLDADSRRILLTGYSDLDTVASAVNDGGICHYLTKPWDEEALKKIVADALALVLLREEKSQLQDQLEDQNERLKALTETLEEQVSDRTVDLQNMNQELVDMVVDLEWSYETMVKLLGYLSELRDVVGKAGVGEKRRIAAALGRELKLSDADRKALDQAVTLHRVGRLALPDELFGKAQRAMNDEERERYNEHPVYAEALVMSVPRLRGVAAALRSQHEHYDGRGFPDRILRDRIPLVSRVLAVARDYRDLLDGMLEPEKLTPAAAVQYIREHAGLRYDPAVVDVFVRIINDVSDRNTELRETCLTVPKLEPGLVLTRDLLTPDGMLLLKEDHKLDEHVIDRLRGLERTLGAPLELYVLDTSPEEPAEA